MGRVVFTDNIVKYMLSISKDLTCSEITIKINEKFNKNFDNRVVRKKLILHEADYKTKKYKEKVNTHIWTDEEIEYLKTIADLKFKDIKEKINKKFNLNLTDSQIKVIVAKTNCRKKRIIVAEKVIWTDEMLNYLKKIYIGASKKEIQDKINKKFTLNLTLFQIKSILRKEKLTTGLTGKFKKGEAPWSKGTKGLIKPNSGSFGYGRDVYKRKVGDERINVAGYIEIKTGEPDIWEYKHRVIYREMYGEIPEGSYIVFANKNRQDLSKDNLICVNKYVFGYLVKKGYFFENGEYTKTGINIAKLLKRIRDLDSEREK